VQILTFFNSGTGTLFFNPLVQNFCRGLQKDAFDNLNQKKAAPGSGGTFMRSKLCQFLPFPMVALEHFFSILLSMIFTGGCVRILLTIYIRKKLAPAPKSADFKLFQWWHWDTFSQSFDKSANFNLFQ